MTSEPPRSAAWVSGIVALGQFRLEPRLRVGRSWESIGLSRDTQRLAVPLDDPHNLIGSDSCNNNLSNPCA